MSEPLRLVLYTGPGCCLCEELKAQLGELAQELPLRVEEVDISTDRALESRFRTEIPVLELDGRTLARHRISDRALRQRLFRAAGRRVPGLWFLR